MATRSGRVLSWAARHVPRLAAWRDAVERVQARYVAAHERRAGLLRPVRFTEKVQWRKLFDLDPRYAVFCDKLAVRDYIADRVGAAYLVPLLWSGTLAELELKRFQPPFVFKSNHASGHVAMVGPGEAVDAPALRARAAGWLAQNHGALHDEPGYAPVPPRLMIERTLFDDQGRVPQEFRLFVFGGRVKAVNTVFVENGLLRNGAFHTRDWRRLHWYFTRWLERDFDPPRQLADMIRVAERLGRGLSHVRVDIFDGGDRFWVGELTLYPWSGHVRFSPDAADVQLGALWPLRWPRLRAAAAVVAGWPGVLRRPLHRTLDRPIFRP